MNSQQFEKLEVGQVVYRLQPNITSRSGIQDGGRIVQEAIVKRIYRGTYRWVSGDPGNAILLEGDKTPSRVGVVFVTRQEAAQDAVRRLDMLAADLARERAACLRANGL
jgi:hypothetical protein